MRWSRSLDDRAMIAMTTSLSVRSFMLMWVYFLNKRMNFGSLGRMSWNYSRCVMRVNEAWRRRSGTDGQCVIDKAHTIVLHNEQHNNIHHDGCWCVRFVARVVSWRKLDHYLSLWSIYIWYNCSSGQSEFKCNDWCYRWKWFWGFAGTFTLAAMSTVLHPQQRDEKQ